MKIAVYPGTFDPITYGHIDIIKKAMKIADRLIIGVALDNNKTPFFSIDERIEMVRNDIEKVKISDNIKVIGFKGLVVNFAQEHNATLLIRGLRAVSDFEYEFQMSGMNSKLNSNIQTVFLPASEKTHFIASRFVKEIARLGGDISQLVSKNVKDNLINKFNIASL